MKDKTVLVTGGAGFIGSHIVERLVCCGAKVRVIDNMSNGKEENLAPVKDKIEFIKGDIRDKELIKDVVNSVDYITHQAAMGCVPRSMEIPEEYNDVNVGGTLNLLKAASDAKVKKFVFASSSSVYGEAKEMPLREDGAPAPISPYALTKYVGERYCRLFCEVFGLDTISLRYFNVFGPRQSLNDDYAVVIPKFIMSMLNGKRPPIFGDGLQTRDFTYVQNIVDANIVAMKSDGGSGRVYNAAVGLAKSILGLVDDLNALLGTDYKPEFRPRRVGDIKFTQSDPSMIRKDLGWRPEVGFREGLKKTIEWFRSHGPKGT